MLRWLGIGLLLTLTLAAVSSSQCQSVTRLQDLATRLDAPHSVLYRATVRGSEKAQQALRRLAIDQHDLHWLERLSVLGDAPAMYALANDENYPGAERWLSAAAAAGYAAAQHDLAMLSDAAETRIYWLSEAATNGYLPSVIALYQWYLLIDDFASALPWLAQAAEVDMESRFVLARMRWREGQTERAVALFASAAAQGHVKSQRYARHLNRKLASRGQFVSALALSRPSCAMRLQFVATSLESSLQASRILQAFADDQRLAQLPVCINEPVWLNDNSLPCSSSWNGQHRLGCDLSSLAEPLKEAEFSHLVVFAEQGKANVSDGVMYLDLSDNYAVFVHELAHFAGFVDEYPLSRELASMHCERDAAPNLLMVEADTPMPEVLPPAWLSSGSPIAISRARTCNNHVRQAYKPVQELTFMEFYDEGVIPPLYLALWRRQLADPTRLTPAFQHFASLAWRQGDMQTARFWQARMTRYRQSLTMPEVATPIYSPM